MYEKIIFIQWISQQTVKNNILKSIQNFKSLNCYSCIIDNALRKRLDNGNRTNSIQTAHNMYGSDSLIAFLIKTLFTNKRTLIRARPIVPASVTQNVNAVLSGCVIGHPHAWLVNIPKREGEGRVGPVPHVMTLSLKVIASRPGRTVMIYFRWTCI